jgi:hypothetical protein
MQLRDTSHSAAHHIIICPQCHLQAGGIKLARGRELIELPEPQPVEVVPARIFTGRVRNGTRRSWICEKVSEQEQIGVCRPAYAGR